MPTTAVIIENAPIACVLAGNDVAKGNLFGGTLDPNLPKTIFAFQYVLKKIYDIDPDYPGLRWAALRLWELCGKYGIRAYAYTGGTGIIGGITPSYNLPNVIDWIVSGVVASGTEPIPTGASTALLNGTNGFPDFRGYNIDYVRGGYPQYTTNPGDGSSYFSWNRVTGLFQIFDVAILGEQMRITPIG